VTTKEQIALEAVQELGYSDYPKTYNSEASAAYSAAILVLGKVLEESLPELPPDETRQLGDDLRATFTNPTLNAEQVSADVRRLALDAIDGPVDRLDVERTNTRAGEFIESQARTIRDREVELAVLRTERNDLREALAEARAALGEATVEWGVRHGSGEVSQGSSEETAHIVASWVMGREVVRRTVTPWLPVTDKEA